ncbi:MAG: nucleoside-diphosphate kinase [Alphaproteobacteria bacterium]
MTKIYTYSQTKPHAAGFKEEIKGVVQKETEVDGVAVPAFEIMLQKEGQKFTLYQALLFYYNDLNGKGHYQPVAKDMAKGTLDRMLLKKVGGEKTAPEHFRDKIGATNSGKAKIGTIREIFGTPDSDKVKGENAIHGTDEMYTDDGVVKPLLEALWFFTEKELEPFFTSEEIKKASIKKLKIEQSLLSDLESGKIKVEGGLDFPGNKTAFEMLKTDKFESLNTGTFKVSHKMLSK